jgi:LDH2 family malate/lactate/ureidoglycolate dehydrogenase
MEYNRYTYEFLKDFCFQVFKKLGVPVEDASIPGEALLKADLMGDPSHGVTRIKRYSWRIDKGLINPKPEMKVVKDGGSFIIFDADNGLGQIAATKAMKICIQKAKEHGLCFAVVRKSNHFGKCGYYSMLALEHDMIGVSMTNSSPLMAPTFGIDPMLGTNPIAVSIPAGEEPPFCFDMATSVRAYSRCDIRDREGREIPLEWGMNNEGRLTINPKSILGKKGYAREGGERGVMLSLGGFGEETAGYKGYGLAVIVDILSGILSSSSWGPNVGMSYGEKIANLGHFIGAINIEAFRPLQEFKKEMDQMLRGLKNSTKGVGYERKYVVTENGFNILLNRNKEQFKRIYVAGEKGLELEEEQMKNGVKLPSYIVKDLDDINKQYNLGFEL